MSYIDFWKTVLHPVKIRDYSRGQNGITLHLECGKDLLITDSDTVNVRKANRMSVFFNHTTEDRFLTDRWRVILFQKLIQE